MPRCDQSDSIADLSRGRALSIKTDNIPAAIASVACDNYAFFFVLGEYHILGHMYV